MPTSNSKLNEPKRFRNKFGRWRMFAVVPVLLVHFGCGSPNGEQAMDADNQQQAIDACSRGDAHFDKGEFDEAIADYTEAIRLKPEFAEAYDNRGAAYAGQGEFDKAISDHTEAIRLHPKLGNAYYNRGVAYGAKEELDKAIADYTEAIRLDPRKIAAYVNRGIGYFEKGEFDKSIADYSEAIQIDPGLGLAYYERGWAYLMTDEPDKAIADFTEVIRLDPRDAKAYFKRALAYEKKGEKGKAESDFAKAKELGYYREGGEPLFMVLPAEDPELTASLKKAQETLPSFLEAFRNGRYRQQAYLVKALFSGSDPDKQAHIWVTLQEIKEGNLICSATQIPHGFDGLTRDVPVTLRPADVEDWMLNVDGKVYGGYSLRVQRRRVPEHGRAKFDDYVGIKEFTDELP